MSSTSPIAETSAVPVLVRRAALDAVMDELKALDVEDVTKINVDIPTAVRAILGCTAGIAKVRPMIVEQLPRFDLTHFDKLETYALATAQAHVDFLTATQPPEPIEKMAAELDNFQDVLVADINALDKRGLIDASPLKELRGPRGVNNVTFNIFTLCGMLRRNWAGVVGKTGVTLAELDHAEDVADRLDHAMGVKEKVPASVSEVQDLRQRAFTVLFNTYDETRRAISYLRWHDGDVDKIAPSFYQNRGGRRRAEVEPEPTFPVPNGPVAAGTPPAPTAPIVNPNTQPVPPPGMPGNPPFVGS